MIRLAVVTGGSGFIGRFLIAELVRSGEFDRVLNLDVRPPADPIAGETHFGVDLREPMTLGLEPFDRDASWIFHLAAACREPGFTHREYFDINTLGTERISEWAGAAGFRNIFFTSTMSSYGRMDRPTPESARQYPETAYGVSKALAERVLREWLGRSSDRRLIVCRPGVIFGPGDKENIPRMIKAVRKGYFLFPGDPSIVKGYGYVFGLVESVAFARGRAGRLIIYNYAERDCLNLRGMVDAITRALGKGGRGRIIRVPMGLLVATAYGFQAWAAVRGKRSAIHPVRVRKVAFPTNLKPQYLIDQGFEFKYPFEAALEHWKRQAPQDWA